jgi:hypothetical protein
MPNALRPAGLPTQPHQGVGARFLRRLGGAVRHAAAGGIALAGLRRPAASQPSRPGAERREPALARPAQARVRRQPKAAALVPPSRPARSGWLAGWFGRTRQAQAARSPSPSRRADPAPFTQATHPGLSAEACAFFNTPAEDCDPAILRLLLAALAEQIAERMGPAQGMDAETLFSTLCGRLGTDPVAAAPDAPPADAAVPAQAPAAAAADPAEPAPDQAAAADPPAGTEACAAVICESTPAAAPLVPRRSPLDAGGGSFRPRRRPRHDRCQSRLHRRFRDRPRAPPPRRLSYAACAGPP